MEITHSQQGELCIVTCTGRIDTENHTEAETALMDIINAGNHRLLLDFSGLDYINSAGLRTLINVAKQVIKEDGKLVIASMNSYIQEVFDSAGFHILIPCFPSVDEAQSRFDEDLAGRPPR